MSNMSKDGVLKLVHPGRFVEIHRRPVSASQVMAENPRHFVTRPDVFKFPWIVVRPESLLKPGSIFFIVPYHTVYRLLRSSNSPHRALVPLPRPRHNFPTDPCHYERLRVAAVDPRAADPVTYSDVEMFVPREAPAEIELVAQADKEKCLKSCLKEGSSARSRDRRVVFKMPED